MLHTGTTLARKPAGTNTQALTELGDENMSEQVSQSRCYRHARCPGIYGLILCGSTIFRYRL